MRVAGVTETARGFGPHAHVCWAYHEPAEFRALAREFLSDGLEQGHRVISSSDRGVGSLWNDIRDLRQVKQAGAGAAQVRSLRQAYPAGSLMRPVDQMRT